MIGPLSDGEAYRKRRREAWSHNTAYWLSSPLRHVTDVGDFICNRTLALVSSSERRPAVIIDMGCGSCWLLEKLATVSSAFTYIGIDNNEEFIAVARARYAHLANASFVLADVDMRVTLPQQADIVVNAFNFFELANLEVGMKNAASWLRPGGKLFMSTIDKTYLLLALSSDWAGFHHNLATYEKTAGVKFDFQKIDLGFGPSAELEYPSVLYTTQDFLEAGVEAGLGFGSYAEQAFTARPIPKIYCHFEFVKAPE